MRNWTNPQRSGEQRCQADQAGPPVETLPAGEAEALRATIRAAEEVVGTRKASATVMVATLAIVAASAALLLGRAAELHASLRGEVVGRFAAASAAPASEIDAPKARLGRALFWDTRISANGQVSCASCHTRDNWGSDSRSKSVDARGRETERQSQSVFHSMEASGLRWLGDRASGAAQAEGSITGSMGFARREDVVPVLERHGYGDLFRAAFPDQAAPVTPANYGIALQAYQATLRTPAPFDRWLAGQDGAMTERQLHGLRRFVETGCANCHDGPLVGGRAMQRFGITGNYWEHTGSQKVDPGLMKLTRKEQDQYVFRVPSLRNVARTQPYFHDGSVAELRHATRIMAQVQLGEELSEVALDELVAFLEALTGQVPDHYAPPLSFPVGSSAAADRP